jgi:DNA-binding CsgD family transcriptional regulator
MTALLERETAQRHLAGALEAVQAGAGCVVVLEAPAGLGKSALLAWTAEKAAASGMRILRAVGSEHERTVPHGVVLQLCEREVVHADGERRARLLDGAAELARGLLLRGATPAAPHEPEAVDHGIWWVVQNLAAEGPLVLLVDDLHWADPPSLRALRYLASRLADMPVGLLAAMRPAAPDAARAVGEVPGATRVELPPLSTAGVAALVAATRGEAPGSLVAACVRATGGNPFYLREVLAHLAPDAEGLDVAPGTVARLILDDVRRAGDPTAAQAVAGAVAVLDEDALLRHVEALAGLTGGAAAAAVDGLVDVGVLVAGEPLRFVHPLAREAVASTLPAAARSRAHLAAARRLHAEGARLARVAAHLLRAPSDGDPWVAETLRSAAREAMLEGAPEAAVAALERALAEPPPPAERVGLLRALGRARAAGGRPDGPDALLEALALLDRRDGPDTAPEVPRTALLEDLGDAQFAIGDASQAAAAYDEAIAVAGDERDRRRLEARYATAAMLDAELASAAAQRVERVLARPAEDDGPSERRLCATLAVARAYALAPAVEVRAAARRALAGGRLVTDGVGDGAVLSAALGGSTWAEDLEASVREATRALDDARDRGAVTAVATVSNSRAAAHLRAGELDEALADAQQALEISRDGWEAFLPITAYIAVAAHVDRGELGAAEAVLGRLDRPALEGSLMLAFVHQAEGLIAGATGRHDDACAAHVEAGRVFGAVSENPAILDWRSAAALAALAMGDRSGADALASEELRLARAFGAPRSIGIALRALGLVRRDTQLLSEAVTTLEASPARLELARALVDRGAALRRAGARAQAREPLARGRDLARSCAAWALERRAHEEQIAAGLRPRTAELTGVGALSPSERRVADLAARGLTNRAIAQTLFVTPKAVEWHLSNAYRKLGIRSRRELAPMLAPPTDRR